VDFDAEDPVETILQMTGGIGVDRAIDAVGVDAEHAHAGSPAGPSWNESREFQKEVRQVAPKQNVRDGSWKPGTAPSQVLRWAVESLAKAGTLSIIGVYSEALNVFPIGQAMEKNLTIKMGNCNHRRYAPHLIELVRTGAIDPTRILTKVVEMEKVLDAYRHFDRRDSGWTKVELKA
jgi:threonine dehydrogenase-like Zn-dependent dehydrogenase